MTSPDWNLQVKLGRGRGDACIGNTGAHHRAIEVARQLLAIGRWPDSLNSLIVIHDPYELHRRLQMSGPGQYNSGHNVTVFPAVYDLVPGRDYEIVPLSDSFRQIHDL
jgi:hypothetical protein